MPVNKTLPPDVQAKLDLIFEDYWETYTSGGGHWIMFVRYNEKNRSGVVLYNNGQAISGDSELDLVQKVLENLK